MGEKYILRTEEADYVITGFVRRYGFVFVETDGCWSAMLEMDSEYSDRTGVILNSKGEVEARLCCMPATYASLERAMDFVAKFGEVIKNSLEAEEQMLKASCESDRLELKDRARCNFILLNKGKEPIKYHGEFFLGAGLSMEFKVAEKDGNEEFLFNQHKKGAIHYTAYSRVKEKDVVRTAYVQDTVKVFYDTEDKKGRIKYAIKKKEAREFLSHCDGDSISCTPKDRFVLLLSKNGVRTLPISERKFERFISRYKDIFQSVGACIEMRPVDQGDFA